MTYKKGAVEWTVGKLLTFILLILVLILVIWGISTEGFKPLYSKVQGQIDEVLIMLNFKEDSGEVDCVFRRVNIDGVGEGIAALCKTYCNLSFEKVLGNIFLSYSYAEGGIVPYLSTGEPCTYKVEQWIGDVDLGEKAREAYFGLNLVLKNLDFMPDDSEEKELNLTMAFIPTNVLQFDVSGSNRIYRWEEDHWVMLHAGEEYSPYPESSVLSELYGYYVGKQGVSWGYRYTGVNMIPMTNNLGSAGGYLFKPVENRALFEDWVNDTRDAWDMNNYLHEGALKKLTENSKTVFVEYQNKKFPYHVSTKQVAGIHFVPVIYFDGSNDVRWSLYYNVSTSSYQLGFGENFNDLTYDIPAKMTDEIWQRTKVLNEVNDYFEENCD